MFNNGFNFLWSHSFFIREKDIKEHAVYGAQINN